MAAPTVTPPTPSVPPPTPPPTPSAAAAAAAAGSSATAASASASASASVRIHLKATGTAPVLAKSKFKVGAAEPFATVTAFLRRQLALAPGDTLFCYLHSAFAPTPSLRVGDLFDSFHSEGELVVHYSTSAAFG